MAERRIAIDLRLITKQQPIDGIRLVEQKSLYEWITEIEGPSQTIWEGGKFKLSVVFPKEYPFKAPNVRFITPIFHPNVSKEGGICLDLLIDKWLPTYNIGSLLVSIRSFLDEPNPDHGLNNEALQLFRTNKTKYEQKVREMVQKYGVNSE